MSSSDQDELISQFTDITGASTERAKFFLESANWTLQLALSSFFENNENPSDNIVTIEDDINDDDDDDDIDELGATSSHSSSQSGAKPESSEKDKKDKKNKGKVSTSGSRIVTLNNMSTSSDDEDERGQAFYAGGSERSGQQVLGPPRKNPLKDYVSDIFRTAQESGAEVVENPQSTVSSSSRSFSGTGYRLGQTNDDHVLLPDSSRANRPQNIEPVVLRLWRQGFTINDGELRLYEDGRNKEFLECISKGQLPPELRQREGNMVQVNLEDHRHEDFKAPVAKIKPFSGKGHTLGSPTPPVNDIATSSKFTAAANSGSNEENGKLAGEQLKLNADEPVTSIQIRLADGSRLSGRFNHTHTIDDLRRYISTARPQYAGQTFSLLTTFPSKELTDENQTIEKAGLLNAAILQRLK